LADLAEFLKIVRRRAWIVVLAILLLPAAAMYYSLRQPDLYEATSKVLLSRQNLAATISGIPDYTFYDPSVAQTQAELAKDSQVAEKTLQATGVTNLTAQELLDETEVTPQKDTDLLTFSITDGSATRAARLATEYARQYTLYRAKLDTASVRGGLVDLGKRLDQLAAQGKRQTAAYRELVRRQQQLQTLEALLTSNASLVRPATGAVQVQPKPVRNGFVGLALGLILGVGLALLWEALDTRVRSAEDIERRLGLPLLARLSEPPWRLQRKNALVMIADPTAHQAESFRMLRTNIDFVNLERNARLIMVSSALDREGKSTTIANLAVAYARTGRRVILVDLDLRRPALDRFFGFTPREGLTNVALGELSLDDAIKYVAVEPEGPVSRRSLSGSANGNRGGAIEGVLEVLFSGPAPPATAEFAASKAVGDVLSELRDRADLVLIDAPPLLQVGDAMSLTARVDALFVVTRLKILRRPILSELARVIEACPAEKLGFVLTGARHEEGYGYAGYHYDKSHAARESTPVG
jgi:polysaccharide biosynthesis transport protein